jgi:hypothetical protein
MAVRTSQASYPSVYFAPPPYFLSLLVLLQDKSDQNQQDTIAAQQAAVSANVIRQGIKSGATQELVDKYKAPTSAFDSLTDTVSQIEDIQAIESLCMNCHEQGTTRLLLTRSVPTVLGAVLCNFYPHQLCFLPAQHSLLSRHYCVRF